MLLMAKLVGPLFSSLKRISGGRRPAGVVHLNPGGCLVGACQMQLPLRGGRTDADVLLVADVEEGECGARHLLNEDWRVLAGSNSIVHHAPGRRQVPDLQSRIRARPRDAEFSASSLGVQQHFRRRGADSDVAGTVDVKRIVGGAGLHSQDVIAVEGPAVAETHLGGIRLNGPLLGRVDSARKGIPKDNARRTLAVVVLALDFEIFDRNRRIPTDHQLPVDVVQTGEIVCLRHRIGRSARELRPGRRHEPSIRDTEPAALLEDSLPCHSHVRPGCLCSFRFSIGDLSGRLGRTDARCGALVQPQLEGVRPVGETLPLLVSKIERDRVGVLKVLPTDDTIPPRHDQHTTLERHVGLPRHSTGPVLYGRHVRCAVTETDGQSHLVVDRCRASSPGQQTSCTKTYEHGSTNDSHASFSFSGQVFRDAIAPHLWRRIAPSRHITKLVGVHSEIRFPFFRAPSSMAGL